MSLPDGLRDARRVAWSSRLEIERVVVFAAGLNAIGQLLFIQAYPFWSLCMFAADIIIIYALAEYAGRRLASA